MEFFIDLLTFLFFVAILIGLVAWVNAIDNEALLKRYGTPEAFPSKQFDRPKPGPADRQASEGSGALRQKPQRVAG